MRLQSLELSGFKSFAKQTVLEFPDAVTAIVGPNGSGKSNVAEAIRWVLGEQSMKSLRGKRGEDLIFNGSPSAPRMGKASVGLAFDNAGGNSAKEKRAPVSEGALASFLDFERITLTRKIFRDGLNEYYINESQVRLKDVIELMARVGLGHTKHNIIGQGEVDRILMASPKERREIMEEALGLRVYQLKKEEAERKLAASEENAKKISALIAEIAPHLKFLQSQAKKAEARETVRRDLLLFQKAYFTKEFSDIEKKESESGNAMRPFEEIVKKLDKEIGEMRSALEKLELEFADAERGTQEEQDLAQYEEKLRELERDMSRIDGRIDAERLKPKQYARPVDAQYIADRILIFISMIKDFFQERDASVLHERLRTLEKNLASLLAEIKKGEIVIEDEREANPVIDELAEKHEALREAADKVMEKVQALKKKIAGESQKFRQIQIEARSRDKALREKEEERSGARETVQRMAFEKERILLRREELEREFAESGLNRSDITTSFDKEIESLAQADTDLRRKIEKMKLRLEEIGGIDPSVVKEYQETETRFEFLTKESEDITAAAASLKELIRELDKTLEVNFKEGFLKIKNEFHNYFRIIFGGGSAKLKLVSYLQPRALEDDFEEETEATEDVGGKEGLDIEVDLPKKRIKSLAMLSGGERALASVALLFAITAVNPPPFLVLDETDAALDEANSLRYAAILRELSKKTQLLVVTHNRETMKQSGTLYGVTMGEDGISKLLSLKLEDAEAYTNR
ncbi:AAA family ATPase [Patescibacteria group bacterium]|nr:AAA family ATPase [Patescibacteria group bacterium]